MTPVSAVLETVIVDAPVRNEAMRLLAEAADEPIGEFSVMLHGESVALPAELSRFLGHILERTAEGGVTTMRSMPEELTTTAAASMIGVSRPTLMKMISDGAIAAKKVGTHNRLLTSDVCAFLDQRTRARIVAFDELQKVSNQVGDI